MRIGENTAPIRSQAIERTAQSRTALDGVRRSAQQGDARDEFSTDVTIFGGRPAAGSRSLQVRQWNETRRERAL